MVRSAWSIDLRSKILFAFTLSSVCLGHHLMSVYPVVYWLLFILTLLFLLLSRDCVTAVVYTLLVTFILIFLYLPLMDSNIRELINEISPFFLGKIIQVIIGLFIFFLFFTLRLSPALAIVAHLFKRSSASEFLNALEQMKLPQIILIPIAVIFRFIPSYKMEHQIICRTMQMKGLSGLYWLFHPLSSMYFYFVPLINNSVRIADELTIAALTHGFSLQRRKTLMQSSHFSYLDYVLWLIMLIIWGFYISAIVMMR